MQNKNLNSLPVNIYYCGHEKCAPGHFFGPAVRQHYLMHFILNGCGTYRIDDRNYEIRKGNAFLINPGETTYYQADVNDPWEYIWIAFGGEDVERLIKQYHCEQNEYIYESVDYEKSAYLFNYFFQIYCDCKHDNNHLIGLIYLIFSSFMKNDISTISTSDLDYFQHACKSIRLNYGYGITVADISANIGIERSYLYKTFIKYSGISPKQYLTKVKIESAAEMLLNTNMNMTEIALSCGFHDSSNFCRNFMKHYKTSPLQYKNSKNYIA